MAGETDDIEQQGQQAEDGEQQATEQVEQQTEGEQQSAEVEAQGEEAAVDEDAEVVISLGDQAVTPADDEEEDKSAPQWVKDLRVKTREQAKQLRQQADELARLKGGAQAAPQGALTLEAKPTLEGHDYDAQAYDVALSAWYEKKAKVDAAEREQRQAQEREKAVWNKTLENYGKAKASLKVPDFDEAEAAVLDGFTAVQQAILVKSKKPAELVYVLGKNEAERKRLASLTDPVEFTYAAGEIVSKINVAPKKAAPPPERVVRGNVANASTSDNTLEKLREEAQKTGDMTKLLRYRQEQRQKATA
jgi:hypothetical protein